MDTHTDTPAAVTVGYDDETQVALLVETIQRVAAGFTAALKAGATEELLVLLLHERTRVAKRDIQKILRAAPGLARHFTTTTAGDSHGR